MAQRQVTDAELAEAIANSPWETMRRASANGSGVRRAVCAYCLIRPTTIARYCGEFCQVADELRDVE